MHPFKFLSAILLLLQFPTSAQMLVETSYPQDYLFNKTPTDTIWPGTTFSPTLYSINNTLGYVIGTNVYEDTHKAQIYKIDDPSEGYNIEGFMFWFGRTDSSSSSSINLNLYDMSGIGEGLNSSIAAPDTILFSIEMPINQISTHMPNFVLLAQPIPIWFDYAIGFDMSDLLDSDTVALLSSFNGEGEMKELAIEQKEDGKWYSILNSFSHVPSSSYFDVNLAFFPIIDGNYAGLEEEENRFHRFQNPATGELHVWIKPNTKGLKRIVLLNMIGQTVEEMEISADEHEFIQDISHLDAAQYFLFFEYSDPSKSYAEKLLVY